VRVWLAENDADADLAEHIRLGVRSSARSGIADSEARYGRRVGWYALVRALKPQHVVETGVDKGLGSCVIAAALLRNGSEGAPGRLTGLDINPDAGYLISGSYATVVDLVLGDSLESISRLSHPVDLFLHDSDHSESHEHGEFLRVETQLAPGAMLLTDNASETDVLMRYAEETGRRFLFFQENPLNHWFPGDGIGAAWRP